MWQKIDYINNHITDYLQLVKKNFNPEIEVKSMESTKIPP